MTTQKDDSFESFMNNMIWWNKFNELFWDYESFEKAKKDLEETEKVLKQEKNLEKNSWEQESSTTKASDIFESFKEKFFTPEAISEWEKYWQKQIWGSSKEAAWWEIEIKYFTKKENDPTFWFAGIAWMKDLQKELRESFINPLKFKFLVEWLDKNKTDWKNSVYVEMYEAYKKFKVNIPTWLLFYWPPWTGKTFITKKLAEELWAWFIQKSAWEFGSSYQHQTTQNIRNFFTKAKEASHKWPILLFLDEIDSILSKRTNNIDANKAEEVSQFLQEFNALAEEAPNLIIIAATNRPDHLDSAILRSWRLDKKIYIGPPDFEARKELFHIYIERSSRPSEKIDYEKLATLTEWYVSSDIETICDEVSRDASRWILDLANSLSNSESHNLEEIRKKLEKQVITMELLEKAISETTSSLKMVDMSVYDNWEKKLG